MFSRLCVLLALFIGLAAVGTAFAQAAPSASLSTPDAAAFPLVQAFLDVEDELGDFIHGLAPEALSIIENGSQLPLLELREVRPGVQLVVAFDPGTSFAIRDTKGRSRGQIITKALADWASSRQGSTIDDLSLLVTNGQSASHLTSPSEWLARLNMDEIDYRQSVSSLETLYQAIELAADPTARPGMGRAVLYITSPSESQADIAIENALAKAQELGVKLFIWMVPVPGAYYPDAEQQFERLASLTGGGLFKYVDDQSLPDLESFLAPLRSTYQLVYRSIARASGSYQVAAQVELPDGLIVSPVKSFSLNLLPPDPAFISPPLEINREPPPDPAEEYAEDIPLTEYSPMKQELQAVVGFPDERVRPLVRTAFYVDGKLVQENRQAPFDRFEWNLSTYTSTVPHMIRVEAEDNLGLVGTSIERLVQVNVNKPARDPWSWVYRNASALSVLAAVVTGSILMLILLLGGRLRPRVAGFRQRARRYNDPVTQPVPIKSEAPARRLSTWVNRIHWPERQIAQQAYGYLSRIAENDGSASLSPLPIMAEEITIGSDPSLATLVLRDPAIEGLHARMLLQENGSFRITDAGSIAGTWINYAPVSREGAVLEHGDLVHFGRIGFRFTLAQPGYVRRPVITPVNTYEVDQV